MHDLTAQIQRSWEASRYLFFGLPVAVLCFLTSFLVPAGLFFALFLIGAPAWPEIVRLLRRLAGYERTRAGLWLETTVPELYLPLDGSPAERLRLALIDPGTWRDTRWLPVQTVSVVLFCLFAALLWPLGMLVDGSRMSVGGAVDRWRAEKYGTPPRRRTALVLHWHESLATTHARWVAALLRPSASSRLEERVSELSQTRAAAVEAHSAELRRIERDLHDGVQAQLVALSLRIGLTKRHVRDDPDTALLRLDEAQDGVEQALADLRNVVRTVHPPVLTDRGLAGAIRALTASSGIPVELNLSAVENGHRLPASVEAAAYFTVAEALTNIRKHSRAARASVRFSRASGTLRVAVSDDGIGGADEHGGSGLMGIRRRVAALDGGTSLSSPPGGPTELRVELPCGS